ncbi:MAG TPA: PQQ-binding-like beta-propeller repeat protein [Bryobacteraceae bacterium]|jgi:outer membrane protein assembly factor BamB|nr:PQQ-binding-like beta-propeller repeat protein [Bryobacteraceae bacterium]
MTGRSRFSQRPIVTLAAALILPPAGLILLWFREGTSVFRKVLGSLAIVVVGVAQLFLFYGMHMELSGGFRPLFSFGSSERHYRQLEAHRAQFQAPEPPAPMADPTPSAPAKAESAPAPPAGSTYWADFLGPGRLGHYDQKPILTSWPAGGLQQVWKQPVGGGYASFTVANGLAFTIEQRRRNEVVAAYDVRTGRERWTHSWNALFEEILGGNGPRATPVWDDGRIYALGAQGELRCLESATGKLIWNKNILVENGAINLQWGMSGSPLVVDGKVIVTPGGGHGNSVVAYDKLSGKRVWGSLDDRAAYASPAVATVSGRRQLLVITAQRAVGLALEDGKLLWEYPWVTQNDINVAQPIVVAANRVYLSAAYGHGAAVLELTPQGDGFEARSVWANTRMKNKFNSAVLHEGFIYGLDDGILACVDAESGELKWKGGRYGYGQLLLASGHLVVLTEEGDVVLVPAEPEGHREVARFSALKGKTWNIPAISDGLLLVRNEVEMAAFRIAAD